MKTAIVYVSLHHGNTKKLLDAICEENDVDLIDAEKLTRYNLSAYQVIGFASGIYYSKFHENVIRLAKELPTNKKIFLIYTCGMARRYEKRFMKLFEGKKEELLGIYSCAGYDTFGILEKIGGIAKGRPNANDLAEVKLFYQRVMKKAGEE